MPWWSLFLSPWARDAQIIGAESAFFARMVVDAMMAVKRTSGKVLHARVVACSPAPPAPSTSFAFLRFWPTEQGEVPGQRRQHYQGARWQCERVAPGRRWVPEPERRNGPLVGNTNGWGGWVFLMRVGCGWVPGYAFNCRVASQAMPKRIENAKIACLDFDLRKSRMKMGVHVVIDDPDKLDGVRQRENDMTKERIEKILATGANVILTTQVEGNAAAAHLITGCSPAAFGAGH